jgi:hypothetical protein
MPKASSGGRFGATTQLVLILLFFAWSGSAQASDSLSVRVGGFVKLDAFHDTRQVVSAREGTFLLYPQPVERRIDPRTNETFDYNDAQSLNLTSFFSRLRADITVPRALGASTGGAIEVDFLGTANGLENIVRLRHAYVHLDWGAHSLIAGQYWSPLFVPEVFPQTASYNLGVPIQPLAWFPQLRYTGRQGVFRTVAAVTMQRDGFEDIGGRHTQQQAVLPGAHLHLDVIHGRLLAGAGSYLRTIRPELHGDRFTSGGVSAYARYSFPAVTVRAQGLYGSNMADHVMLGGYVETLGSAGTRYRPTRTASAWANVMTNGRPVCFGLFAGVSTNLGLGGDLQSDEAVVREHIRGAAVSQIWRVSPQVAYHVERLRIALEVEGTAAKYADERTASLRPVGGETVTNIRTLLTVFLFF